MKTVSACKIQENKNKKDHGDKLNHYRKNFLEMFVINGDSSTCINKYISVKKRAEVLNSPNRNPLLCFHTNQNQLMMVPDYP